MGVILQGLCSRQVPNVGSIQVAYILGFPTLGEPAGLAGWFQICPGNQLAAAGGTRRAREPSATFKLLSKNPSRQA